MKKLLSLILILSILVSCKDDEKVQPELTLDTTGLSFSAAQEDQTFTVTSNVAWTVTSSQSWCTFTPASGNGTETVTVKVTANDGTGIRPATITVKSELGNKELPVTQLGIDPVVLFDDTEDNIVQAAIAEATVEVKITTNAELEVTPKDGWIHFLENTPTQSSTVGRTLKFKLDENDTGAERTGKVEVKDKNSDFVKTLTFKQSFSWRSADSITLLKIYEEMDGANWDAANRWDVTKPLDQWSSNVTLNTEGRVEELYIYIPITLAQDVSMPAELAQLTDLKILRMYGRKLSELAATSKLIGTIPVEFGNLTKLEQLGVSFSGVSGEVPSSLGNLSSLKMLLLQYNKLTGSIPSELGGLNNLTVLYMQNNSITGSIPSSLGQLSQLSSLDVASNQLTGTIPSSIGELPLLTDFNVKNNQLSGEIPASIKNNANWSSWKSLICSQNGVGFTNCEDVNLLRQADSLTMLKIYNLMDGANWEASKRWDVTKPLDQWNSSIALDEEGRVSAMDIYVPTTLTQEVSLPAEIGDLTGLQSIRVNGFRAMGVDSKLTGTLPAEIGNLTKLTMLSIINTGISGNLPSELGQLSELGWILMQNNAFTGSIPSSLGNLTKLGTLQLYGNKLSGSIPTELGQLSNLTGLFLHNNQLTGGIPSGIGGLSNLVDLNLSGNQLTGSIPSGIGSLSKLSYINLSNNQLTGGIPSDIENLSNLMTLALSNNELTGSIPSGIGGLSNLVHLVLNHNQLSGSVPIELGQLSNLIALSLLYNQLSGEIPALIKSNPRWSSWKDNICPQNAPGGFTNCN